MTASDHLTRITDGRLDRSLTPNMDALEIALADMKAKVGGRVQQQGRSGARARMMLGIQEGVHRPVARELDAGGPETGVADLLVEILGDVIAGHVLKFCHRSPPHERAQLLEMFLGRLSYQARRVVADIDNLEPHEVSGVMAPRSQEPGRS